MSRPVKSTQLVNHHPAVRAVAGCTLALSLLFGLSACNKPPNVQQTAVADSAEVDDLAITNKIRMAFQRNDNLKNLDIQVVTVHGLVNLTGTVNSARQIDASVNTARTVGGVTTVSNNLQINPVGVTADGRVDDDEITTKVHAALVSDAALNSANIAATSRNGEVSLSGSADNQAQIARSVEIAQNVDGVRSVLNHLTAKN